MTVDDILFSTIVRKSITSSKYSARIIIPETAIKVSNSVSDFFEIRAYSDRIEIRAHQFRFINKKKNAENETAIPKNEESTEPPVKDVESQIEETCSDKNDSAEQIMNQLEDVTHQLEK